LLNAKWTKISKLVGLQNDLKHSKQSIYHLQDRVDCETLYRSQSDLNLLSSVWWMTDESCSLSDLLPASNTCSHCFYLASFFVVFFNVEIFMIS